MTAHNVTILIIDDHSLFRSGLEMILVSAFTGLGVLEADSVEAALANNATPQPDLVLLDVRLNGLSGLESIGLLRRRWPGVPVIMLSSDSTSHTVRQAMERGADGFVSKADASNVIIGAIRSVMARTVFEGSEPLAPVRVDSSRLTLRQSEVLHHLSQGLSNKSIAKKLDLSENTVRGHVQAIMAVLTSTSRTEAVFNAKRLGLID